MGDEVVGQSKFRTDALVRSGSALKRDLLSAADPAAAVQALNPIDLLHLAEDLGEADAMDLVALASPEQIRSLVDFGSFRRDTVDFDALERWFSGAIAHGFGSATRFFHALDEEVQTLYLARRIKSYQLHDEEVPEDDVERYNTPDGTFSLELREPSATGFSPMQLIAELYAVDWQAADLMIRDANHTIVSELEDTLQRLRDARLGDLGFPSYDDAMKLWSRPNPERLFEARVALHLPRRPLPVRYAEPFTDRSFIAEVFARLTDDALIGDLEGELVAIVNSGLIANRLTRLDADTVLATSNEVRALLSLGLEVASKGELGAAVDLLQRHTLRSFLRVAMAEGYKLKAWAEKALKERLFHLPNATQMMFSGDESAFIESLTDRFPRFRRNLGETPKAFGSRIELANAQRYLEHLTVAAIATKWATQDLDLDRAFSQAEPALAHVTWRPLLRSALLVRALGDKNRIVVTPADARAFRERYPADSAWPAGFGERPIELVSFLAGVWASLVTDVAVSKGEPQYLELVTAKG